MKVNIFGYPSFCNLDVGEIPNFRFYNFWQSLSIYYLLFGCENDPSLIEKENKKKKWRVWQQKTSISKGHG